MAPGAAPGERGYVGQGLGRAGLLQRGGHDRRVRQHPAGRQVGLPRQLVAQRPQLAHHGQAAQGAHPVDARGAPPGVGARRRRGSGQDRGELLLRPSELALGGQLVVEHVAQLDEHLDVERGVAQPVLGERPVGPVGRRVALLQAEPEDVLHHRAEADALVAEQPPGQLGVEQLAGGEADLRQAGEVLRGGVQDDLGVGQRRVQLRQVGAGGGVDERAAGAGAA